MEKWKIKKEVILSIMELSKASFPNEFSGMLVGDKDKKLIDDIYIIPLTQNHRSSSSIRLDLVPMSFSVLGTVHSHPSISAQPSRADLNFFQSKAVNIIAHYPYGPKDFNVYNNNGEETSIIII
jgi:proteasome lid subunit RPN8/RPN11